MKPRVVKNPVLRGILKFTGFICITLGLIGIPLPVLPTTPFLILAAVCFSYSSEHFYNKVVNHPRFGAPVKDYLEGRGIPLKAKIVSITVLWLSILLSCWLVDKLFVQIFLPVLATYVTWFILREPNSDDPV